ncbi:RagB/SusD family nutrient uptake outer membrane protein [Pararcticibacter amylolyticus]|uniref:RagB/SusD family nutrient uptake outer membrane protein n=1 Tax=Pararcticibacter amylolyticus TaxID=2173175 RepID=A0A2U2PB29_9SPHI|nr:RagB/SusD family nutrient uptake outer membrane protein [Pararcticibacter amylolyticus]PWG78611.1 RagB/SusD family nutrient uptake outer membrane protein [Pararcticibacter amylolyticus]
MKNSHVYISLLLMLSTVAGCRKLDRFPLDSPSTITFYSTKTELELAVNALYNSGIYPQDSEEWSDNFWNRAYLGNEIIHSTATVQSSMFSNTWLSCYKGIARANGILDNINKATDITAEYRQQIEAQARFARAYGYSLLIVHFGDVPLIKTTLSLADSYKIKRTPAAEVQKFINDEFDFAASILPASYKSGLQYFTKGAVLGMKARLAISLNDWGTAADAAKQIMDLKVYSLYPSYRNLFLRAGQHSSEIILSFPRSITYLNTYDIQYTISRLAGGFASNIPSHELIDSYECTDGNTIDKSPLYNVSKPFANRDPRLSATIVTPGDTFLGYVFQNHPDSTLVFSTKDNKKITNKDNKGAANPFASFTGYLWKKGIDDSQLANINKVDLDQIVLRYAEILLIYAEAKIELNQVDQSVLDAINMVRARGYGVSAEATASYPAVTTTAQAGLRKILRRERRIELALEGRRYLDLLRWKLIDKVFSKPMYGVPLNKSDYPYPGIPVFDADDIPSYDAFASKLTVIDTRVFDAKFYIWPVPYNESALNSELGQNPGW